MSDSSEPRRDAVGERFADVAAMQAALKQAARDAIREHARAGRKIVVWRDGKVVWEDAAAHVDET